MRVLAMSGERIERIATTRYVEGRERRKSGCVCWLSELPLEMNTSAKLPRRLPFSAVIPTAVGQRHAMDAVRLTAPTVLNVKAVLNAKADASSGATAADPPLSAPRRGGAAAQVGRGVTRRTA